MNKKIPYAVANFEEIKGEKYIFIDKTSYITELEKYKIPVFLRPRRFGKSLWCSLLECYYDIKKKDRFDELFGDLYIGQNPTPEKNKYLVMRLDFSKIEAKLDAKFIEERFLVAFKSGINEFLTSYKDYFKEIPFNYEATASDILIIVLSYIKSNNLPPVYLIIDEYDNFTNQLITAHLDGLYYELTTGDSFLRSWFKIVKAGIGERTIERVFITGILPITIDDLTSSFNIAEIITLKERTLGMLGFTQNEVDRYLEEVYDSYNFDKANMAEVKQILVENYNGYKFLPDSTEKLYNSTILTYFLKNFALGNGNIPREIIDDNLRTDVSWIRRLTQKEENTREMLETLLLERELPYDSKMVTSKFSMNKFFEKDFYPLSLFYLGMLTFKDSYAMKLPNLTMKQIFVEYFNIIEDIEVSKGYTEIFRTFERELDINKLFQGYWDIYVRQFPAQVFDKVNENFYRITFYELCTRYLSHAFTFAIETNYPSGRSDWEMLGKFHTKYKHQKFLVEFKYYSNKEGNKLKVLGFKKAKKEDIDQVKRYEKDILKQFLYFKIRSYVIYIVGNKGFRCFEV
ncbi:MAG: AAA family ATPase [bacterium]